MTMLRKITVGCLWMFCALAVISTPSFAEKENSACAINDYDNNGPYKVKKTRLGNIEIFEPTGPCNSERKMPLIVFSYGFSAVIADALAPYDTYAKYLASKGYLVAFNKNGSFREYCKGEQSILKIAKKVFSSRKYSNRVAKHWGVAGHSMGATTSARLAVGREKDRVARLMKAAVAVQPAYLNPVSAISTGGKAGTTALLKSYQILCKSKQSNSTVKPTLFLGGNLDRWGEGENPYISFEKAKGPAFVATQPNAGHILDGTLAVGRGSNRSYLRAAAAWFRCHLDEDSHACNLFKEDQSICDKDLTNCIGKNL